MNSRGSENCRGAYKCRGGEYERQWLTKAVRTLSTLEVMSQRIGRATSTIYDWMIKWGLHSIWVTAKQQAAARKVVSFKQKPKATYLSNEHTADGHDLEVNPVKLQYMTRTKKKPPPGEKHPTYPKQLMLSKPVSRMGWNTRYRKSDNYQSLVSYEGRVYIG